MSPAPSAPETPTNAPVAAAESNGTISVANTPAGPAGRYFLMKQVKIIDQGLGQGKPAYDLMIPTTWQFKGWVNVHVAEGGCFADWFSVFGDAKNADGSIELQILPQYTWQYIDNPAGQQQMQVQNQRDAQVGMKPCPVRAPVNAEDFLRQDLMPKAPKNATLVGIEPFPELERIVRDRLGAPSNTNGLRIQAARARMSYIDESGKPNDAWLTAATVVRRVPSGGSAAYDSHAIMVMFFRAPKGQLDANDRLFQLMASTIHPEPQWQQWSNGVISSLYQKKAQELAKQRAMIAEFQQHVVDTINGVTARQMAGANQSAFGQDQLVRSVQTFRDPATGATFELSNQFDHAWSNGSNEYVMSDDPNYNPNGNIRGNWNQLELVRAQP